MPSANPRGRGLSASATTLLALVAVATAASALHSLPAVRVVYHETPGRPHESQAMRAVAAAVADLARDLLGAEHTAALPPTLISSARPAAATPVTTPAPQDAPCPHRLRPPERLLDLPPPVC
ncbi:MAG: hypothetical protein JSV91_04805 [Phycisphaerales bacterium]|nr:MAG: hypothetical protein JSV91_04805 [Phycisphaerales bacterium]